MVYYRQHLNVNRLWLEQIMYEVCLQVRHIIAMCCQGLCRTVRYTLMNLQWFRTIHLYMAVYGI